MKILNQFFFGLVAAMIFALPLTASSAPDAYQVLNPDQEVITDNQTVEHGAGHNTNHKGSNHFYVGTTLFGDQIVIEDGSYWMTKPDDRYKLQNWDPNDPLMLMQNKSNWWFSSKPNFPFVIYNERTCETIEVENSAAPIWDSFYTHYIVEIYKPLSGEGTLKLNDGSVWVLPDTTRDRECWTLWLPNHTIIIGTNNSYWTSLLDILINITCSDQYVPSKCIN